MKHHYGMTLVELMVVVAIIAVLTGIFAYAVAGNRSNNAQVTLFNEVHALMQAQRMRASNLGLATYVEFGNGSTFNAYIPRIGETSTCTGVAANRLPIRYTAGDATEVAIDVSAPAGGGGGSLSRRTTSSIHSTNYITVAGEVLTDNVLQSRQGANAFDNTGITSVCFQPNGQVLFYNDVNVVQDTELRIEIRASNLPNAYGITITGMGMIYTETIIE